MSRLAGLVANRDQEPEWADGDHQPSVRDATPPARPKAVDAEQGAPRGRAGLVLGLTVAGAVAGGVLALAMPRSYVATAELLVDPGSDARSIAQLSPETAFALVDNQVRVLKSGTMLGAAADRLNLASDTEFGGSGIGSLGGLFGSIAGLVSDGGTAADARKRAVDALANSVSVDRVDGSSAITVSARSGDPAKSALLANTLADLFVSGTAAASGGSEARAATLEELRGQVESAERAVETYKAENDLVDAQGRLITDEEIIALGERLSQAKARTTELNARAASTREADVDSIVTGSLPEQFASPTLSGLRERYAGLKQQMDRASVKLGPRHPERLAAEAELAGARQEIGGELRRVAGAVQTELKRAVQQEQELAAQLAQMKVRQGQIGEELIELRELERDAASRRAAYEDALRGARALGAAMPGADARILSRAEPPASASGLPFATSSLVGALAGLFAGIGLTRRRDDTGDEAEGQHDERPTARASSSRADAAHGHAAGQAENETRRSADANTENGDMYPYPYQAAPYAAPTAQPYAPQPVHPAPVGWQPAPQGAWVWTPAGAMPQAAPYPQPGWPQAQQAPGWPPMPPVDPWAHLRGYPQPFMQQGFQPPVYAPPPPVVVYAPVPQQTASAEAPRHTREDERYSASRREEADRRPPAEEYDHDRFVDERTNAAIEEIRQSLREFREAIEDLADDRFRDRDPYDRYGT